MWAVWTGLGLLFFGRSFFLRWVMSQWFELVTGIKGLGLLLCMWSLLRYSDLDGCLGPFVEHECVIGFLGVVLRKENFYFSSKWVKISDCSVLNALGLSLPCITRTCSHRLKRWF